MIYLLIISLVSMILIVYAYTLGIRNTLKVIKKETIENPFKILERNIEDINNNEEIEKYNTLIENINNYDPRGLNQKDVE